MRRLVLVTSVGLMLAGPPMAVLAQPPAGRLLASQCAQCHGTNGQSVGGIDKLAGESTQEIYQELLEMKYTNKTNDIMHRQAKGYNESQLWLISQYYGSLSNVRGSTSTSQGQEITGNTADDDDKKD